MHSATPYDIHFSGIGKKNNEKIILQEYISKNLNKFKDKTIICDRAYFCYDFFDFLDRNGIKFIIRIRNNAKINKKNFKYSIISKKSEKINDCIHNINDVVSVKISDPINLVTNISNYVDNHILDLYHSRWDIEEFFKQIKKNFTNHLR